MDAAQALADLSEISSQIQAAVLFDEQGAVVASTPTAEGRGAELAAAAQELLAAAGPLGAGGGKLAQLEAATEAGSVFVVDGGQQRIVAVTAPQPTVGLVFYDLKSCLRSAAEAPKPKRRTRRKKAEDAGDAA
jgi:predicted regulator of Ras-like GTPase activity (Roadblock/LC7/MglB family)